jgi:hypothetical protein
MDAIPPFIPWTKREKRAWDDGYELGVTGLPFATRETDQDAEAVKRADGFKVGKQFYQPKKRSKHDEG